MPCSSFGIPIPSSFTESCISCSFSVRATHTCPSVFPYFTALSIKFCISRVTSVVSTKAEISFFAKQQEIKGKVLTNDTLMYNLCDNNPLTYSSVRNVVVFDMGQPVSVTEIRYLPRNDANGIYPNNEYELFYYGIKGWESLGVKVANDDYIVFDSVPLNSLLWLHNRTTGREERIFTYEDGQQRFW